jgi:predicted DNA-binding transcriptional regulator YafY
MLYQRSLDIERRLDAVLALVREGKHSAPEIARHLHVSIPTVSRDLMALRQRGQDIRAERGDSGWRYFLHDCGVRITRQPTSVGGGGSRRSGRARSR